MAALRHARALLVLALLVLRAILLARELAAVRGGGDDGRRS